MKKENDGFRNFIKKQVRYMIILYLILKGNNIRYTF